MMRRSVCALVCGALLLTPFFSSAVEQIERFDADITVRDDASVSITETITYDFGSAERHGIYRYVPTTHPQEASSWLRKRGIGIDVTSVARNGTPEPYEVFEQSDEVFVRIGDPNVTITGRQVYTIAYDITGGLSYHQYEDAELYWNVTGTGWQVPILNVEVTVHDPDGIFASARACYTGVAGESTSCTNIVATTSAVTFTARNLAPGTGLTIAQSLDSTAVERVVHESLTLIWVWVTLAALWLCTLIVFAYRRVTAHDPDLPEIAQYEPYGDFRPMFTGVLIDGSLEHRDIAAGLMYLAEQGFIHITQTDKKVFFFFETKDYEVRLMRDAAEAPEDSHRELLALLFGSDMAVGDSVRLSDIKGDTRQQQENQKIISGLRSSVRADLVSRGFYETFDHAWKILLRLVLGFVTVALLMTVTGSFQEAPVLAPLLLTVTAVLTIVTIIATYRRKTRKGYEAANHLEGFKRFLSVTDKERFAFHNAPAKSPEQFMAYLPYAVAFGVEKEWAAVFKDITIPNPSWYSSTSGAHFSAAALTSDLTSFSQTLSSSATTSGSSGGGSVGGGTGGGGGGSW